MDGELGGVCGSELPIQWPGCQICSFLIILISVTGVIYRGDLHSACHILVLRENSLETRICLEA